MKRKWIPRTNAFDAAFLERRKLRNDPILGVHDAMHCGPWRVVDEEGRYVLRKEAEHPDDTPIAVMRYRETANLLAAILPGYGLDAHYTFGAKEEHGYPLKRIFGDQGLTTMGWLRYREHEFLERLAVVEQLSRSPRSLAFLLRAVCSPALEQAGNLLIQDAREGC